VVYSQKCPKYDRTIKAGDGYLNDKKFKEAIVEYQAAQIAAKECEISGEELVERFKRVFDALAKLKDDAETNRIIADKATALAKERLAKEQVEKQKAEELNGIAQSQVYANAAYIFCERDPTIAISFAFSSLEMRRNRMALMAMLKAFNFNSWFYNKNMDGLRDADLSPDGSAIAKIAPDSSLQIEDLRLHKTYRSKTTTENVRYLPNGNLLTWSKSKFGRPLGAIELRDHKGMVIGRHVLKFVDFVVDEKGMVALPVAGDDGKVRICRINPVNGKLSFLEVPESFGTLSLVYATSSKFTILCNSYPGNIWITPNAALGISIAAPPRKLICAVDIKGLKAAFYIKSSNVGEPDLAGILNLDGVNPGRKIVMMPLKVASSPASTGSIKFLDENNIIATSSDGWSQIINLPTKENYPIDGLRPIDQIIPIQKDSLFVLARRSGEITIYDLKGIPINMLRGNGSSDGVNQAVSRLTVDKNGEQILTVSRGNAKLWQRPHYNLKYIISNTENSLSSAPSYFTRYNISEISEKVNIESDPLLSMPVNNVGEVFLQFHFGGYSDLFRTSLQFGYENVADMREEDDYSFTIFTDKNYKRKFIVKPELVYRLIKKEFEDARILLIDDDLKSKWIGAEF
jgi:hypothetical protein